MYKLQQICGKFDSVQLPDCMYKLPNVYAACGKGDCSLSLQVSDLSTWQESIIERLKSLRDEVDLLKQQVSGDSANSAVSLEANLKETSADTLVICANPTNPPLSILVLVHLLRDHVAMKSSVFSHSSIHEEIGSLGSVLSDDNSSTLDDRNCQFFITLIWKKVSVATLTANNSIQPAIYGEGNIARYLARLLKPAYDALDPITATSIDEWVDSGSNPAAASRKDVATVLRSLSARLGMHNWLVGESFSLADVVMWSFLHQLKQTDSVPNNVKKWLKACEKIDAFAAVQKVISC